MRHGPGSGPRSHEQKPPFVLPVKENIVVKKLIRGVWGPVWAVALMGALVGPIRLRADEPVKPVVILSIASVDHLMENFAYLTKVAGRGEMGGQLQGLVSAFIQDFDRTRPAGVLITMEDGQPKGVGFLPIPDADKVFRTIKDKLGAEVDDLGGGMKKLTLGKGTYLKQQGDWLYFTDHPRHLARLPADPVAMLGGLDKQYAMAVRFFVGNIPQSVKDVADYSVQAKIDADLNASHLADPEIDTAFLETLRASLKKWASTLINDSDQITIGWAVDSKSRRTYIELNAQSKDGSSLSHQLQSLTESRSAYTGFLLDDAAVAFQGSLQISEQGQQQIDAFLQYVRKKAMKGMDTDPNTPEAVKEIASSVLDVVDQTVRQGKTDVGATLLLAPESFKFVAGVRVADGHALADAFQRLFELAKHQPNVPEVNFFAEKYRDLDLHTLVLPIAESDKDARKILGQNVDITIATGPESLYFALGKGSDTLLKKVADRSAENGEQKVAPVQLRVALKPIMNFLASVDKENLKQSAMAEVIEQASGGDGILLRVQPIDGGIGCRLEIEEGVLELIGKVSQ